jgi:hypothetical protein
MDYFEWFAQLFSSLSGLGFLVGITFLWKVGLLEFLLKWKKNGNGLEKLEKQVEEIHTNHLHEVKERLATIETKLEIIMRHLKI